MKIRCGLVALIATLGLFGGWARAQVSICQQDYEVIKSPSVWNAVAALAKDIDPKDLKTRADATVKINEEMRAEGLSERDVGMAEYFLSEVMGNENQAPLPMQQAANQIFKNCTELQQAAERGRAITQCENAATARNPGLTAPDHFYAVEAACTKQYQREK